MDDDLQHNPKHIESLIKEIQNQNSDFVIAKWGLDETISRNLSSYFFSIISSTLVFKSINFRNTAFRAFKKEYKEEFVSFFISRYWIDPRRLKARVSQITTPHENQNFRPYSSFQSRITLALKHLLFDSYLVQRGLYTLGPRIKLHSENAHKLAEHLESSDLIKEVRYPGLKNFKNHEGQFDLYTESSGTGKLFEIKTWNQKNLKEQIRNGIIKLLEYRIRYQKEGLFPNNTDLYLMLDSDPKKIISKYNYLLDLMEELNITLCWLQNNKVRSFKISQSNLYWIDN